MEFNGQTPEPSTLPRGDAGKEYTKTIQMLPNVGSLQNILVEGDTDGLAIVISDASENKIGVSGTPIKGGTFPVNITVTNSVAGESKFTI